MGPLTIGLKLLSGETRLVNMMLEEFAMRRHYELDENGGQFDEIIHPESMLAILLKQNITKTISLTNYYAKLRSLKMKFRPTNVIGYSM